MKLTDIPHFYLLFLAFSVYIIYTVVTLNLKLSGNLNATFLSALIVLSYSSLD